MLNTEIKMFRSPILSRFLTIITVYETIKNHVTAHSRWKCPLPRDSLDTSGKHIAFDNTGNKNGPCGPINNWGYGSISTIKPGWNTISWEESVSHKGSPFRIVRYAYSFKRSCLNQLNRVVPTTPLYTHISFAALSVLE